jgi:Intracellular proteinase inhibitor/Immunoglobulin-like domain of bacterial spore germination
LKAIVYLLISSILFVSAPCTTEAEKVPLIFSVKSFSGEEGVEIQLKLYNNSDRDIDITFPTSQMFDFTIKNNEGKVFHRYSEGKSFLQALQTIHLKKGETKVWKERWNYTQGGKRVPEGDYTIEALLMGEEKSSFKHPLRAVESFTVPEENPSFRDVKVREVKGRYTVSGQARVANGSFYYSVEDGHRVLLSETLLKVNKEAPNWTEFSIILPKIKGRTGQRFLNLYERDDGDGKIIHPYVITIP